MIGGGGGVSQIMTVDDRGEGGSQPNVMSFLDEEHAEFFSALRAENCNI